MISESSGQAGGTEQLSVELLDLFTSVPKEIRVVLIGGKDETAFDMPILAGPDEDAGNVSPVTLSSAVAQLEVPVIAAIPGRATGPGMELILACDIRIASDASSFALPHIRHGLIPWDGATQRLPRLVGKAKALELLLCGEKIPAEEAMRIGLVNRVVPPDALMETAAALAGEMASRGPLALRFAKEAVSQGLDMTLAQGLRLEADLYFLLHTTKDRVEGIQSFREKRPPHFEGS
jgi:enoyl-CoA hydratase/carnithine racemase